MKELSDEMDLFLKASACCDSNSKVIARAAKNIAGGCKTSREAAIKVFYWVRNTVKYELGHCFEHLAQGQRIVHEQANLAVALRR